MIVDTSAWVEYLRATGSPVDLRMNDILRGNEEVLVPEVVVMELCMGPTDDDEAEELQAMLRTYEVISLVPMVDTLDAATLARRCRRAGETVRSPIDCLVAAVALRLDQPVLHRDRDFEVLARHTGLRIVAP